MKKLALLLTVVMLSTSVALASKYPKYDAEVKKIRTVKNAQTSVIKKEMKDIAVKIEAVETNTTMSSVEKRKKIAQYNAELNKLSARELEISTKYNSDKAKLKKLYKHN